MVRAGTRGDRARPPGRPRLYDEPLAAISLRLPVSHLEQVDARARGQSRSEYLREVIADTLGQRAAA